MDQNENSPLKYRSLLGARDAESDNASIADKEGGFADADVPGYLLSEKAELALNMALVTGRPLLVRGPTGCGKTALARAAAKRLDRAYLEAVITSRTEARDLLWKVDLVGRLADAQCAQTDIEAKERVKKIEKYVVPGVLWWAFNPADAKDYGREKGDKDQHNHPPEGSRRVGEAEGSVVLLDEIDKADPDLPNNLLVPLGSLAFRVAETGHGVEVPKSTDGETVDTAIRKRPLVIITTNSEKELPDAFLRRCIVLTLDQPATEEELIDIAKAHFRNATAKPFYAVMAQRVHEVTAGSITGQTRKPSTAEFLDAVRCVLRLCPEGEDPKTFVNSLWTSLESAILAKPQ